MLTIRPFSSAADYAALEQLDRAVWPTEYQTAEEFMHFDESMGENFNIRLLAELDGRPIGWAEARFPFWWSEAGLYMIGGGVVPELTGQGWGTALYNALLETLAPLEPQSLVAFTQEDRARAVRFLEDRGFRAELREPRSMLDVPAFDRARFAATVAAVAAAGVRIYSVSELSARDADWQHKLWEIRWPIRQDIPSAQEKKQETLDEFVRLFLSGPTYTPDGFMVAVAPDGSYIGYSIVEVSATDPHKLYTRTTGVLRAWRRRGVATALKLRIIDFARAYGATQLETDNEENNPMYQLNLALGFQPLPAWVTYKRRWPAAPGAVN